MVHSAASINYNLLFMFHIGCLKCYLSAEGVPLVYCAHELGFVLSVPQSGLCPLIPGAVALHWGIPGAMALHSQPFSCLLPILCKHNPLFPLFKELGRSSFVKESGKGDQDLGTFSAFVCWGLGLQCLNGMFP